MGKENILDFLILVVRQQPLTPVLQKQVMVNSTDTHRRCLLNNKVKDLYTTGDIKRVREQLIEEQMGFDLLTLRKLGESQAVLDHSHNTLLVRGVLNRSTNSALGKLENAFTRYLAHCYDGTLSNFLRQAAVYLERTEEDRWRHPHFLKKLKTAFNKLPEGDKSKVLKDLGYDDGKNGKDRKAIFAKMILDRNLGYDKINSSINKKELTKCKTTISQLGASPTET